jgi:hypothetical protein
MNGFNNAILAFAAAALCVPAMAQTATTTTTTTPAANQKYTVNQHKNNQQERIGNGVENGSLTAKESSHVEKQETQLNKEEHIMRADDNGKLTSGDRAALKGQQNHLSSEIYRDKHNAAAQNVNPKSEVGQRQRLQQERIGQGIKSGQLNARESSNLERREAGENKEIAGMRQTNGGRLTGREKALVNRQDNRDSRAIYRKKHNSRARG